MDDREELREDEVTERFGSVRMLLYLILPSVLFFVAVLTLPIIPHGGLLLGLVFVGIFLLALVLAYLTARYFARRAQVRGWYLFGYFSLFVCAHAFVFTVLVFGGCVLWLENNL